MLPYRTDPTPYRTPTCCPTGHPHAALQDAHMLPYRTPICCPIGCLHAALPHAIRTPTCCPTGLTLHCRSPATWQPDERKGDHWSSLPTDQLMRHQWMMRKRVLNLEKGTVVEYAQYFLQERVKLLSANNSQLHILTACRRDPCFQIPVLVQQTQCIPNSHVPC